MQPPLSRKKYLIDFAFFSNIISGHRLAMDLKQFLRGAGGQMEPPSNYEKFKELEATELYCSTCKRAVNVRKHLLLVLPEGEKYEYRCVFCNGAVGSKIDRNVKKNSLII